MVIHLTYIIIPIADCNIPIVITYQLQVTTNSWHWLNGSARHWLNGSASTLTGGEGNVDGECGAVGTDRRDFPVGKTGRKEITDINRHLVKSGKDQITRHNSAQILYLVSCFVEACRPAIWLEGDLHCMKESHGWEEEQTQSR